MDWMGEDADGMLPGAVAIVKPSFSMGLLAIFDVSKTLSFGIEPFHLAVQPEFVYSSKGTNLEIDGEDRGSINLTYLQTALLVRGEYDISRKVIPYFLLGPELAFLLTAEYERPFREPADIEDNLKSTDLGLVVGVGSLFEFPPWGAASMELRADLGLVSIDDTGYDNEIRNAALLLLLGYLY